MARPRARNRAQGCVVSSDGLWPEQLGDVVADVLFGDTIGRPIAFEVQRVLYSAGAEPGGRAVMLTLRFAPGSRLEQLHVPLDHASAARLARMLAKHAAIVARKLAAEGS